MNFAELRSRLVATQFRPGAVGLLTNPFYFARAGLYENIRALAKPIAGRTLDVGCGQKPYRHLFASTEYVGLEFDSVENRAAKRADVFYDGRVFPFPDGCFDSAVASQVFEHIFNPNEFLRETRRVLKPGGSLLMTIPFVWDEHEQPFDYARYSSFGITHLLETHGFRVIELRKSMADFRAVAQLANAYLFKTLPGTGHGRMALASALSSPVNAVGALLGAILPQNPDLYLDNIVLARRES